MTRRRVTITRQGTTLSVRGWRAGDLLREAGTRPIWTQSAGWMLDKRHLADVLAYLSARNIGVSLLGDGEAPVATQEHAVESAPVAEAGLW